MLIIQNGLLEQLMDLMLDPYNENIAYIFKIFNAFILSLVIHMGQIEQEKIKQVSDFVLKNFQDVVYTTLLILKAYDGQTVENQAGLMIRPLGMKKLRALEFLLHLIGIKNRISQAQQLLLAQLPEEHRPAPPTDILSPNLLRHIISTLTFVLELHSQNSISNQLASQILLQLQSQMQQADLATLQAFVQQQLTHHRELHFPSGHTTSQLHTGTLLLIAFQLKKTSE